MVIKATKFTPELLLGAPRRSAGSINAAGTWIIYSTNTYDFTDHAKHVKTEALEIATEKIHIISESEELHDFAWLDDDRFLFLRDTEFGKTEFRSSSISESLKDAKSLLAKSPLASIDAEAANLKVKQLDAQSAAVVFSAEALPDGSPFNSKKEKSTHSTGKLYTSLFVRHWDRYETKQKNSLWYGKLHIPSSPSKDLPEVTFFNALRSTGLESPIRPFGGSDHFDLSKNRVILVAKDPDLNPALNTKVDVFLLDVKSWTEPIAKKPEPLYITGYGGAKTAPVFSPDGAQAAFLAMRHNRYESDKNRIFIVSDVKVASEPKIVTESEDGGVFWDRSPSSLTWSADASALLATVEDHGQSKVFYLPLNPTGKVRPEIIFSSGNISSISRADNDKYLFSGSSLVDNSFYGVVEIAANKEEVHTSQIWSNSLSSHGNKFGLSEDQVSSIWTPASNPKINEKVHSWVIKPSNFDKSKKYPVAYLVHGGPQAAWLNAWSTRWNPAVYAEQGYIVIAPNPTGSTSYGQLFTDAIRKNWGGDPYQDIVNVFDWVSKNLPEANNDNAVALGASYGGYMMNWIQGHDLGRKFKALVNHDGTFSTMGMLATEELYFPFEDLGGLPFYNPYGNTKNDIAPTNLLKQDDFEKWKKWDPTQYLGEWSTPTLIIHSTKDYRICIADGLAAFNILQARGVESEFLTFPDENHWVLQPENSLVWHKVVLNWINKHTGLPPYTTQDPKSDEFWGDAKKKDENKSISMPTQGVAAI